MACRASWWRRSPTRSTATGRACAARASTSSASPTRPGVNDLRESPALNVMKILTDKGAVLSYSDPYVPAIREEGLCLDSQPPGNYLANVDCVVVLTAIASSTTAAWPRPHHSSSTPATPCKATAGGRIFRPVGGGGGV